MNHAHHETYSCLLTFPQWTVHRPFPETKWPRSVTSLGPGRSWTSMIPGPSLEDSLSPRRRSRVDHPLATLRRANDHPCLRMKCPSRLQERIAPSLRDPPLCEPGHEKGRLRRTPHRPDRPNQMSTEIRDMIRRMARQTCSGAPLIDEKRKAGS